MLCGWASMIWGCVNYARFKGRSGWLGLFGYLFLPGLLLLVVLSNRRKALEASGSSEERERLSAYDRRPGYRYLLTLLPIPLILVAGGVAVVLAATSPIDPKEWQQIDHPELGFRALMPGTPKQVHEKQQGDIEIDRFTVRTRGDREAYAIVSTRIPPLAALLMGGPAKILDLNRQQVIEASKAAIKDEHEINLMGHPGRELVLVPAKGLPARLRMFVVKNQLLQVSAQVPIERLQSDDIAKFLDSLEVTAPPPDPPR
jgi:hypothetical protein